MRSLSDRCQCASGVGHQEKDEQITSVRVKNVIYVLSRKPRGRCWRRLCGSSFCVPFGAGPSRVTGALGLLAVLEGSTQTGKKPSQAFNLRSTRKRCKQCLALWMRNWTCGEGGDCAHGPQLARVRKGLHPDSQGGTHCPPHRLPQSMQDSSVCSCLLESKIPASFTCLPRLTCTPWHHEELAVRGSGPLCSWDII